MAQKPSKRPRAESTSGSSSDEDEDEDKAAMLAALQAHTRAMLGLDGPDEAESSEQGRRRMSASGSDVSGDSDHSDGDDDDDDAEGFTSDDGWGEGDEMVTDSEDEAIQAAPAAVSNGGFERQIRRRTMYMRLTWQPGRAGCPKSCLTRRRLRNKKSSPKRTDGLSW
jgi:hypothetical protein